MALINYTTRPRSPGRSLPVELLVCVGRGAVRGEGGGKGRGERRERKGVGGKYRERGDGVGGENEEEEEEKGRRGKEWEVSIVREKRKIT